ncbi:hypothetical protein BKA70DRAFT_1416721 [Coprinopsis sp. MPI-PUGE-AT-0042]|nr:hypothetical protein BKA70DRAFT_1416721 [Coprinopsis sp. MPI-PUGE-AT-0042]
MAWHAEWRLLALHRGTETLTGIGHIEVRDIQTHTCRAEMTTVETTMTGDPHLALGRWTETGTGFEALTSKTGVGLPLRDVVVAHHGRVVVTLHAALARGHPHTGDHRLLDAGYHALHLQEEGVIMVGQGLDHLRHIDEETLGVLPHAIDHLPIARTDVGQGPEAHEGQPSRAQSPQASSHNPQRLGTPVSSLKEEQQPPKSSPLEIKNEDVTIKEEPADVHLAEESKPIKDETPEDTVMTDGTLLSSHKMPSQSVNTKMEEDSTTAMKMEDPTSVKVEHSLPHVSTSATLATEESKPAASPARSGASADTKTSTVDAPIPYGTPSYPERKISRFSSPKREPALSSLSVPSRPSYQDLKASRSPTGTPKHEGYSPRIPGPSNFKDDLRRPNGSRDVDMGEPSSHRPADSHPPPGAPTGPRAQMHGSNYGKPTGLATRSIPPQSTKSGPPVPWEQTKLQQMMDEIEKQYWSKINHDDTAQSEKGIMREREYRLAQSKAIPALWELELAQIELSSAEARRKVATSQLEKAQAGQLGIDHHRNTPQVLSASTPAA